MCGRYASKVSSLNAKRWKARVEDLLAAEYDLKFNVTPTNRVPVWLAHGHRAMHWGLIPRHAVEPKMLGNTFNAKLETLSERKAFRAASAAGQRCLIPALGYYEWRDEGGIRQPSFIYREDGEVLAFAGLWERWSTDTEEVFSCTILTKASEGALKEVHHRMPIMVPPDRAEAWFNGTQTEARVLMDTLGTEGIRYHRVGRAVGNVHKEGPSLIEPAPIDYGELWSL